jgi:hydrogenase maturation protease
VNSHALISRKGPTSDPGSAGADLPFRTVVLGIGNTLLTDEGIGVHVIEALRTGPQAAAGVEYVDGGTLSFSLAAQLHGADRLIVVDAAQLGAAPGTHRVLTDAAMDRFLTEGNHCSVHEVGLADLLQVLALEGSLPGQRALVAIQPDTLDWGDAPTAAVADAMPAACRAVQGLIERWPA